MTTNNPPDSYYHGHRAEMRVMLPAPPYRRILEVGCAAGHFSGALQAEERWGVEPVADVAEAARERGLKVLVGFFGEVEDQIPDGGFDLIIANDVIEHMADHDQFLRTIRRKLSANGCLVASVPNVRYLAVLLRLLFAKDWRYGTDGVLDRTHLRFFTERSLRRALADNGFEVEALTGLRSIFRLDPGISLPKTVANWAIAAVVMIVTLGHALDTRFLQFGIRARPRA